MNMSILDISIVLLFLAGIIWWALHNRKNADAKSYFLAGKSQGWFLIGLSLFAASVSTSTLIGHSGEGFISGLAVYNYNTIGAVVVIIFVALFFLPFYVKSGIYTIPEYLGKRYDNRSRKYFSIITIIGNVFLDAAATLYTGALLLKVIFPDVPLMWVIIVMAAVAGIYSIIGGLSSIINADMIQSVVLIVGSVVLSVLCFNSIGGWDEFINRFNDGVWLKLVRPMNDVTMPYLALILTLPVLGFYFWGNNQMMVQRVLSAKSLNEGRLGFLFVAFLYIFTLFIFIMPGLIARGIDLFGVGTALPNEIIDGVTLQNVYGIDTNQVYPLLIIKLMPVGIIGVIVAAMMSALISTLSATLNSASTLFTMDFYRGWKPNANLVRVGQISSFIVLVIAVIWSPLIAKFASLVAYYQEFSSYLVSPIVGTFLLGLFWKRSTANGAFYSLIGGLFIAGIIMTLKFGFNIIAPFHFLFWAPILLCVSIILNIVISLCGESPAGVGNFIWNKKLWKEETVALKGVKWYKNFRILSVILLILTAGMYLLF
jgi:SSS family solute:Na+ symporter